MLNELNSIEFHDASLDFIQFHLEKRYLEIQFYNEASSHKILVFNNISNIRMRKIFELLECDNIEIFSVSFNVSNKSIEACFEFLVFNGENFFLEFNFESYFIK